MTLYTFTNLANKLTQLGYPEAKQMGFQIIKKDLTQEQKAGNIDFKGDGIYLNVDGHEYKGYMYIKEADIQKWGFPKFHITECQTIIDQKARGAFDGHYFWHNSNTVTIKDRRTGKVHESVTLELCGYCSHEAIAKYSNTEGFYNLLDKQELEDINREIEVDIFGYTRDWQKISREYKKEKEYKCESCGLQVTNQFDKRYIHVHHRNGDKLNNRRSNLECVCILCHSFKDSNHQHNTERRRMQAELKTFVNKYRKELTEIKNPFLNRI